MELLAQRLPCFLVNEFLWDRMDDRSGSRMVLLYCPVAPINYCIAPWLREIPRSSQQTTSLSPWEMEIQLEDRRNAL